MALRAVVVWSHILSPTLTATRAHDLVDAVEHVIGKVDAVGGEVGIAAIVSAWPDDRAGDYGPRRAKLIDRAALGACSFERVRQLLKGPFLGVN